MRCSPPADSNALCSRKERLGLGNTPANEKTNELTLCFLLVLRPPWRVLFRLFSRVREQLMHISPEKTSKGLFAGLSKWSKKDDKGASALYASKGGGLGSATAGGKGGKVSGGGGGLSCKSRAFYGPSRSKRPLLFTATLSHGVGVSFQDGVVVLPPVAVRKSATVVGGGFASGAAAIHHSFLPPLVSPRKINPSAWTRGSC